MQNETLQKTILDVVQGRAQKKEDLQAKAILEEIGQRLNVPQHNQDLQQAILTYWYDLFRSGHLSWGIDLVNSEPPWCHLTQRGRETLKHLSRDPANPEGYMEYLKQPSINLTAIAQSYVEEALQTYNANCYKATAVLIGAAAEGLILDLATAVHDDMKACSKTPPKGLKDWRVKTVFETVRKEFEAHQKEMGARLAESFAYYWPAFLQQIRAARNEAGHPSGMNPVTPELVHAAMLTFPELARLIEQLKAFSKTCKYK